MKGLAAIALALIAMTTSAEEYQSLYYKPGENDRSKWILGDGKFVTYETQEAKGPLANYEVRNGNIVRESICKGSKTPIEQCARILAASFARECIIEKITTYCVQYKQAQEFVEMMQILKDE